jgi:hypothetical protein
LEDPRPSQEGISGQLGPDEKTHLPWTDGRREISDPVSNKPNADPSWGKMNNLITGVGG